MKSLEALRLVMDQHEQTARKNDEPQVADGFKTLREALDSDGVFPALMMTAASAVVIGGPDAVEAFKNSMMVAIPSVQGIVALENAKEVA